MAKRISQQAVRKGGLTRTQKLKQKFAQQRAEQEASYNPTLEQQKREVSQKISYEQQRLTELNEERIRLINAGEGLARRRQINERYQKLTQDVNSRIRALQTVKSSLNKGYYFKEGYIDNYVSSYANQSAQARETSIRNAQRRIKAREQQKEYEKQKEELSKVEPEDVLIVEQSKDGKFLGKKYFALAGGKTYEIDKPTDYLKAVEQAKADYNKQVETAIAEKKLELQSKLYVLPDYVAVTRQPRKETIQDTPQAEFVPYSKPPSFSQFVIGGAMKGVGKAFSFVPDEPLVLKPPKMVYGVPIGVPIISTQSLTPEGIPLSVLKESAITSISGKKQQIIESDIEARGIKAELEPKYQELYQTSFERQYYEPIIKGEIEFESAKEQFADSDVGKLIGTKYSREIDIKRAEGGYRQIFKPSSMKIAGLSLAEGVTELAVPTTTKEFVVKGVVIGGTILALKKIPYLAPAVETSIFATGTAKFLNPLKLPEERFTGGVQGLLAGTLLTTRVVKWARTPVIKTKNIYAKPRLTRADKIAKTYPTKNLRGWEREISKDIFGKTVQKDYFKFSKLDEQIISGRRTIVSTKLRTTFGFKPIYQGVPFVDKAGYTKAFKVLSTRTSLSTSQVKDILRFKQPKAFIYETKGITSLVQGDEFKQTQLFTKGYRITTPEVREINKLLGIKTRGGIATKDFFTARGSEVATKGDLTFYRSIIESQKTFLTPDGSPYMKLSQAGKSTKTFEQLTAIETKKTFDIGEKVSAQLIKEQSIVKQLIPKLDKPFYSKGDLFALAKKQPLSISVDYRELTGISAERVSTPKTQPSIKDIATYSTKDAQKLIQSLEKVYGKPAQSSKVPFKVYEQPSTISTQKLVEQATTLKVVQTPPILEVQNKLSAITKITPASASIFGTASLTGLTSASESALKQRARLNTKLDEIQKLDFNLDVGSKQEPKLKQSPRTTTSLRTVFAEPQIRTSTFRTPTFPTETPLRTFPPIIDRSKVFLKKLIKTKKKKKKGKEFSYAPTFTEKALGIKAVKIKPFDAEKLVKTEFTGFEGVLPVVRLR